MSLAHCKIAFTSAWKTAECRRYSIGWRTRICFAISADLFYMNFLFETRKFRKVQHILRLSERLKKTEAHQCAIQTSFNNIRNMVKDKLRQIYYVLTAYKKQFPQKVLPW